MGPLFSSMSQSSSLRLVETTIRVVPTFSDHNVEDFASFLQSCELIVGVLTVAQIGIIMRTILTRLARELVSRK